MLWGSRGGGEQRREAVFPAKKQWIVRNRRRVTLPLPKRGSSVHALIEFALRFRLSKRIARKKLFIEQEGPGALFPTRRGPRGGVIRGGAVGSPTWFEIRCTVEASVTNSNGHLCAALRAG